MVCLCRCTAPCLVFFIPSMCCCWNGRPCPAVQQRYSVLFLFFNSRAHNLRVRAGYVRAQPPFYSFPSSFLPPPSPTSPAPSALPPPLLAYHRIALHRIAHHSSFSRLQFIKIYNDLFFGFSLSLTPSTWQMALAGPTHPRPFDATRLSGFSWFLTYVYSMYV